MPKGRNCNPCTRRDGQWFCHPNVRESPTRREPESTADKCFAMQKQNFSPSKLNDKLPSLYKVCEKNLSQGKYPFSTGGNRYSFDHTGEHHAYSQDQKKDSVAKQTAHTIELWNHGMPSGINGRIGFTIYQTSYQGNQNTERPFYRRYPKIPSKCSQNAQSRNPTDIMWFGKNNSEYRTPLEVLGITQHPNQSSGKKFQCVKSLKKNCL